MRKLRVRVGRLVAPLIFLGIALCCVTMAAPGFTFFGRKYVDLEYDGDITLKGEYPSVWRLRFNRLTVGGVDFRDVKFRGFPPRPALRRQPQPLDEDFPLAFILHGVRYNIGELTPDTILALGGHVYELPYGDKSCNLWVGPHTNRQAAQMHIWFSEDRPTSFSCWASDSISDPMVAVLSHRGGPPLRLPASEKEIMQAFGPPQHREERVILPQSGGEPLQIAGSFRSPAD